MPSSGIPALNGLRHGLTHRDAEYEQADLQRKKQKKLQHKFVMLTSWSNLRQLPSRNITSPAQACHAHQSTQEANPMMQSSTVLTDT